MRKRIAKTVVSVVFCAAFGAWGSAQAARVDNLYSASVAVEDASPDVRAEALKLALASVLVRVTGSRGAASIPELQQVLENASAFVQVYRYGRNAGEQVLSVTFDGGAVEKAVADSGVAVWGRERPAVIVWLAIDYGGGQRVLLSSDNDGAVASTLRNAAEARGIPVSFPLMDAEDREKISFADVWGGFTQAVEAASQRYQPDAILVGRARRRQGRRLGVEWKLHYASGVIASEGSISEGIDNAADYFAREFAVGGLSSQARVVTIEITDVNSLSVFARVLAHLENLSVVEALQIDSVDDDTFVFELSLKGSGDQLRRAISLANVLQETASGPLDSSNQRLRFRPLP